MLSLGDRLSLVRHVLCAIPNHSLVAIALNKSILKRVNRAIRGFLWAGRKDARGGQCKSTGLAFAGPCTSAVGIFTMLVWLCAPDGFGCNVLIRTVPGVTFLYLITRRFTLLCALLPPGSLVMVVLVSFGWITGSSAAASPSLRRLSSRWSLDDAANPALFKKVYSFSHGYRISRVPLALPPWSSMSSFGTCSTTPTSQISQTSWSGVGPSPESTPPLLATLPCSLARCRTRTGG